MAAAPSAHEPLDRLPAELNNVLFHIGRVFKTAHQGDSKALHQARSKAKVGIPQAQSQFDSALDDLEKDLTDARTVLNRDLATLRAKRAEREKAAGAARLHNGQPKAIKVEPGINVKTAQGTQKPSQTANPPQSTKDSSTSRQNVAPPAVAAMGDSTSLNADIDSMFTEELSSTVGTGSGLDTSGLQQTATNGDAQLGADALFSEGTINLESGDFPALNSGDQDEIHTILPGLEKYMTQPQNGSNGSAGQSAPGATDDFDLEALLNDMVGGGSSSQTRETTTTGTESAKPQAEQSKSSQAKDASTSQTNASSSTAPAAFAQASDTADLDIGDANAIDFSNESTFDIDFDELTAGAGDGSTAPGNDDLGDWFHFD